MELATSFEFRNADFEFRICGNFVFENDPLHLERNARDRDYKSAIRNPKFYLSSGARQHLNPTVHPFFRTVDFGLREELQRINLIDWINRTVEILFVTKRDSSVNSHSTFEASVRGRPLFVSGGHALLWLKRLTNTAGQRIDDVSMGVDPGGQTPNDIVHTVQIYVRTDCNCQPHALVAGQHRRQKIALPPFLNLVALLDLDDAATPVSH